MSGSATAGIATVESVENEGFRTPPGAAEQIARPNDQLAQNEKLRTGDDALIRVRFMDGSSLRVEPLSEVVLSKYVFDGNAPVTLLNLNDGLFHFSSNSGSDHQIKLRTPVATIGVRGTDFLVRVGDEWIIVDILEGTIEVAPRGKGRAAVCVGGQSALVRGAHTDAVCGDLGSFSSYQPNSEPLQSLPRGRRSDQRDRSGRPRTRGKGDPPSGSAGVP